ncbi:MAG: hypothetical protein WBB42_17825 [Polyangiales bacterium]
MTRWFVGFSLLVAALGGGQVAGAQDEQNEVTVAVPGLRAIDGDDGVANELTGWLRAGASAVQGWQLHTANVSLDQFMIVHGCEDSNENCLSKIAEGIAADRLISGSVSKVPTGNGDGYDFEADLFYFDASTGQIEKTSTLRFPRSQSTPQELAVMAQIEVQALADAPLDELGKEQALDLILSRETELGLHQSTLDLLNDRPKEFPAWPAAVSYTGTLVFLGLSAWSWSTIRNVEKDPAFQRARLLAGPEVNDVCAGGSNLGVEELGSLCSKADRHETLQWVFLSMGLASAGVGTWLLVKSAKSKKRSDRAHLHLMPIAGRRRGGVTARLEF